AGPHAYERLLHRVVWRTDADVETGRVEILHVLQRLRDHVAVVRTLGIEPEDRRVSRQPRTVDRECDPVADRQILGAAHAPDVAGLHGMLEDRLAGSGGDPDDAVAGDLE